MEAEPKLAMMKFERQANYRERKNKIEKERVRYLAKNAAKVEKDRNEKKIGGEKAKTSGGKLGKSSGKEKKGGEKEKNSSGKEKKSGGKEKKVGKKENKSGKT